MVVIHITPVVKSLSVEPLTLNLPPHTTISEVKAAVNKEYPRFSVSRQKLSLNSEREALRDESTLADIGLAEGGGLNIKDLGPQVDWQTVFLVEYAGPLVIHFLVWNSPRLFYGRAFEHSLLQKYIYAMVMSHFIKRQLETLFVHRFSHSTMPIFNIFKNSFHYWFLGGVLAYDVYSPKYSYFEASNFYIHLILRRLRPANSKHRAIPFGYLFKYVSCPNYAFELAGWLVVCAMTRSWGAYIFTVVSTGQMLIWARKKHRTYKKEFGDKYPRSRKAMIPFII